VDKLLGHVADQERVARTAASIDAVNGADLTGVSVLIVEDHADSREALAKWLSYLGAVVTTASNAVEAIGMLTRHPLPDLIVCDMHLPGMDGCDFLSRIRAHAGFAHIPVLAVTGDASMWERIAEVGFAARLMKPMTGAVLGAEIARVLKR
jgi:CheY-like chemotaxis protein